MIYCGLICEYNPMHTGHVYQLSEIRRLGICDAIVCAMSGNFVQRAEPAIVDKNIRTKIALKNGADAVIQIPTINTLTGGERFSRAGLSILNSIKGLEYLAFGCESNNYIYLKKIARIRANETDFFKDSIKSLLNEGLPYPAALARATIASATSLGLDAQVCGEILEKPNNILAIEYLKTIYQNNYRIEPVFIHRQDNYNSVNFNGRFASATSLRTALLSKNFEKAESFLACKSSLIANNMVDYSLFEKLVLFSLRKLGAAGISRLCDCAEGIENKLYENALRYTSLETVIEQTKSKRYTHARLKRIAIQSLLSITKNKLNDSFSYGKILGIRSELKRELADFTEDLIVSVRDTQRISDPNTKTNIEIDILADDIYSLLTGSPAGSFFKDRLIEVY